MIKILKGPVSFEWDKGNIDKNWKKHEVTNQEAEEVFVNEPLIISKDIKHSQIESRFQSLGKTNRNRLLFCSFVIRRNKIRIISIRDMSKKEVLIYKQNI